MKNIFTQINAPVSMFGLLGLAVFGTTSVRRKK